MTEQSPGRPLPYTAVLAYETPDELPPGKPDSPLVVTVDPPALYVRGAGRWVPVASVEGDIPTPTLVHASETEAGVAEIATQEETDAGADSSRIVTPARLAGRTATEARSGVVELATAEEARAGTDTTRAVHPAGQAAEITRRLAPPATITPTLFNGWSSLAGHHPAGHHPAGYYKDVTGRVHLAGTLTGGSVGSGFNAFFLPVGYRPGAYIPFHTSNRVDVASDGAMDMNWSTRYDVDGYLRWDAKREVWVGSDGFAHDGAGLRDYSRSGGLTDA